MTLLEIVGPIRNTMKECDLEDEADFLRFILFALIGGVIALVGMFCNAAVAYLFVARFNYRHSPFFFMGFVAFFDCILSFAYLLTMAFPMSARQFHWSNTYLAWLTNAQALMLLVQVVKLASVSCLVVASYERFMVTKHWTNSGFDYSVRWFLLIAAIALSVVLKLFNPTSYVVVERRECHSLFTRFLVERSPSTNGLRSLMDTLIVGCPFITLVFLNLQIVLKIRKQNVQDLRSLITQLTLGRDLMEIRRENLRSATRSLLFIITTYLLSNCLALTITTVEYFYPGYYEVQYPQLCRFFVDLSNLLTVFGNALRPPSHLLNSEDLRTEMLDLFFGKFPTFNTSPKHKAFEELHHVESPWFSALLTTRDAEKNVDLLLTEESREPLFRRRSFVSLHPLLGFDRQSIRKLSKATIV
ncbi:hypothetical protein M3Y95_00163700 [Aphelenchoides besseyi]|nr:hypothetical protein M3Y95_00163700 [Aphelenchoides besseyi]